MSESIENPAATTAVQKPRRQYKQRMANIWCPRCTGAEIYSAGSGPQGKRAYRCANCSYRFLGSAAERHSRRMAAIAMMQRHIPMEEIGARVGMSLPQLEGIKRRWLTAGDLRGIPEGATPIDFQPRLLD